MREDHYGHLEDMYDQSPAVDEGLTDPVLRCDACNKIVLRGIITTLGHCNHCGNVKFRMVNVLNEDELIIVKKLDNSENFLSLFHDKEAMLIERRKILNRKFS